MRMALLQVLNGAPRNLATDAAVHDLAWNALLSLVRDMGTFTGRLSDLMSIMRQSQTSSEQLSLLIR